MSDRAADTAPIAAAPSREEIARRARLFGIVKAVGALVGLGLTALMVDELGPRALAESMRPALATLPWCFACEAARILFEALATRSALGPWARHVPFPRLYAMHVVTYAVGQVLPMPRPAAEATKAALLRPHGVPLSASISTGATLQAATFVSVATMSLVSAGFVAPTPGVPLRGILLANAALLASLGTGLRALARAPGLASRLARRLPRHAAAIEAFREESARGPLVPLVPALFLVASMALNVVELWLVGRGVGARGGLAGAFAAFGAQIVAATVAVAVPGQVGAREATFRLAAGALGTTALLAVAISAFTHGVQLTVALVGFAVLLVLRTGPLPQDSQADSLTVPTDATKDAEIP